MRVINVDELVFDYSGLAHIDPHDFQGIAKYFAEQVMRMSTIEPEIIRCKDCRHFELDHYEKLDVFPVPIVVAHEICKKWAGGCKTNIDGWCYMAERKVGEKNG